jgi:hypothetical protein
VLFRCCLSVLIVDSLPRAFLLGGALGYNDQPLTYRDYANMYYRDFFFYTREKRSSGTANDAGLIMSRPVDCLVDSISKVSHQCVYGSCSVHVLVLRVCETHTAVVHTVKYRACRLV